MSFESNYLKWAKGEYGRKGFAAAVPDGCTIEIELAEDRGEYQSPVKEKTAGAYLGLVNLYPESMGDARPDCTPSRTAAARRVQSQATKRRVVYRDHYIGH